MKLIIQTIQEKPILFSVIIGVAVLLIGLSIGLIIDIRRNRKVKVKDIEKLSYPLLGTVREIKIEKEKNGKKNTISVVMKVEEKICG